MVSKSSLVNFFFGLYKTVLNMNSNDKGETASENKFIELYYSYFSRNIAFHREFKQKQKRM